MGGGSEGVQEVRTHADGDGGGEADADSEASAETVDGAEGGAEFGGGRGRGGEDVVERGGIFYSLSASFLHIKKIEKEKSRTNSRSRLPRSRRPPTRPIPAAQSKNLRSGYHTLRVIQLAPPPHMLRHGHQPDRRQRPGRSRFPHLAQIYRPGNLGRGLHLLHLHLLCFSSKGNNERGVEGTRISKKVVGEGGRREGKGEVLYDVMGEKIYIVGVDEEGVMVVGMRNIEVIVDDVGEVHGGMSKSL